MLGELFTLEVPEISENVITIMVWRVIQECVQKLLLKPMMGVLIGACVGMRGSGPAVSSELNNERVDVIL